MKMRLEILTITARIQGRTPLASSGTMPRSRTGWPPARSTLSFTMSETTDVTRVDTSTDTSTVPEPQTYALIVIGLGVMGIAARRRLGI